MQSENPMSFFSENVDGWGAAEWFDRAAKAIRSQDKANVKGDDIAFETYRMIAASSLARLVRDHEDTVRAALSTDVEPDGWICEDEFTLEPDEAWEWEDRGFSPKPFYFSPQQSTEPVKTAPAVVVKALQEIHAAEHAKLGVMILDKSEDGKSQANWQGGRVNGIAAAISALSAQVQDVDPIKAFAEWLNNGTEIAKAAGNVIDVRVTTPCGNKLRLTGGASPASKHGDAE